MKTINLLIDNNILDLYTQYYFKEYPRRKKSPIKNPNHPSINSWMIMKRQQMNALKQSWKDFTCWVVNYYGYSNLQIEKCNILFEYEFKSKRRRDPDNMIGKFSIDGLVESGLLLDDSYSVIQSLTIKCKQGVEDRTNIVIEIIE